MHHPAPESGRPPTSVVMVMCALVLAPTLAFRIGVDQGVFAYMAGALLEGAWPYVHTWEADYPGLIFLQALEILVFGKSVAMFRLFDLFVQLANAYFIFRIGARLSGRTAGTIAAVLFCLIYQGYGPWNTAQREGFGLFFLLGGFWTNLTRERRPHWVSALIIGVGVGIAFTFKPTLLAFSLAYAPLALQMRSLRAMTVAAAGFAGLLAPALIVIAGYWSAGWLTDLYEACVAYQPIYTARLRGTDPVLVFWFGKLTRLGLNAMVVPVVSLPLLFIRANRQERLMVWLGYVGGIYSVFVQGTFAGYHYLPSLALGAVLLGNLFSTAASFVLRASVVPPSIRRSVSPLILAIAVLAAASPYYMRRAPIRDLATLHFLDPPRPGEFRNNTVFDFTETHDVANYLRERTQPGQPIQVWGYESLVYYLADRPAASRFQMTHPLVMRVPGGDLTPMQLRWRAEFVAAINARRPAYVAVVRDDNWWWAPEEKTSEQLLDDFPEWKAVITRDYRPDTTIGRFVVYRRLQADTPAPSSRPSS